MCVCVCEREREKEREKRRGKKHRKREGGEAGYLWAAEAEEVERLATGEEGEAVLGEKAWHTLS